MPAAKNWICVTESSFAWEQEALEFVRAQFPTHEPYRAWTNFEFIADVGSIFESIADAFAKFACHLDSRLERRWISGVRPRRGFRFDFTEFGFIAKPVRFKGVVGSQRLG
ncbi:hypothetical protein N9B20_01070 [Mariniblastus sp.]|nr:hypothetical protein [Mariniblastus sp.]